MNPIRRREFLEWGALATLSASGCAGTKELLPPSEPISTAHMDDYLLRLDRSMGAILEADTTLNGLLPPRSQRVAQVTSCLVMRRTWPLHNQRPQTAQGWRMVAS